MDETKVVITWLPGDVQTLRPNWSLKKCAEALWDVRRTLQDRSIELGWEVLEQLLDE